MLDLPERSYSVVMKVWSLAPLRRARGISLEQIAQRLKLRVAILKAIEDGNFDELPGGIYNISYLRQFAREIGADENLLVRLYEQRSFGSGGVVEHQNTAQPARTAPTREEIAAAAYALWQQRGCPEGTADEDWREAERQLKRRWL